MSPGRFTLHASFFLLLLFSLLSSFPFLYFSNALAFWLHVGIWLLTLRFLTTLTTIFWTLSSSVILLFLFFLPNRLLLCLLLVPLLLLLLLPFPLLTIPLHPSLQITCLLWLQVLTLPRSRSWMVVTTVIGGVSSRMSWSSKTFGCISANPSPLVPYLTNM